MQCAGDSPKVSARLGVRDAGRVPALLGERKPRIAYFDDNGGGNDTATFAAAVMDMEEPIACSAKTPVFVPGEAAIKARCVLLPRD